MMSVYNYLLIFLDCIVVSIPLCHAGDRGSIPRLRAIGKPASFVYSSIK